MGVRGLSVSASRKKAALLCVTAIALSGSGQSVLAMEEIRRQPQVQSQAATLRGTFLFEIPAGDLSTTLERWSETTKLKFISSGKVLRGLRSVELTGRFSAEDALKKLLTGSHLDYGITGKRTITIFDPHSALTAHAQAGVTLDTITVEGEGINRTKEAAVSGPVAVRNSAGTKTDAPIIETPQTVNVVTSQQIAAQGSQTIIQAVRFVPGVTPAFGDSDFRYNTLQARGFFLREYVDGVRVPFGAYSVGIPLTDPYSLEKIEILKGPASVLYGQTTPGGIINQISRRPSATRSQEVQVQGGTFDRLQGAFDFTGALDPQAQYLYRITGLAREADGQVDYAHEKHAFIAPAFTWRPTSDTSLTFLSNFQSDKGISDYQSLPARGTLWPNPNGQLPRSRYLGEPNYENFDRDQYSLGYAFQHRFSDQLIIRQNVKYWDVDVTVRAVPSLSLAADNRTLSRFVSQGKAHATTFGADTNAQIKFATGAFDHTVLAGVDYLKLKDRYNFSSGVGLANIDIYNPVYGAAIPALAPRFWNVQDMNHIGIYIQ